MVVVNMFDVSTCPQIFAEKLLKEKSFDAAIKKLSWVIWKSAHEEGYKKGYEDGLLEKKEG